MTLERLAASPWILRERGSGTRGNCRLFAVVAFAALSYGDGLAGNSEAIKHAVRHGLGISCLSRRVIAEQLGRNHGRSRCRYRAGALRCGVFIIGRNIFPNAFAAFFELL